MTFTVNNRLYRKTFLGGFLSLIIYASLILSIVISISENYYKKELVTDKIGFFLQNYQIESWSRATRSQTQGGIYWVRNQENIEEFFKYHRLYYKSLFGS